ncbi:2-oxoglutarate oxidoreductase subunit KorB [Phycisphaerae bacterium RAS1]|nr:2-oxoglutarate oxidoreductase subunit KorB [Phycisphaerae bacterium RAS1]
MSVLTVSRDDMCYCPGCSHAAVLEKLAAAVDRLNIPPHKLCLVSDIGCIGTADRYFRCHTFHGLHGRSFTYAEGIKRYRPDLTVVVLVGDGGCGIGTAHLVHAARRGAGIKVLVCNNFNFGMTGGQHSPTTPGTGRTSTTPDGTNDRVFDLCQTATLSGAAYVARCSALDACATDYIAAALQTPGFALLDLWEICTAYYMPANKLSPAGLRGLSAELGLDFGVRSVGSPRPTAEPPPGARRAPAADTEVQRHENAQPLPWPRRVEICVAGSAGQRIRSAVGVIGEVAVAGGLHAAQLDDFPITVRRGHSISNLIVDRDPILYAGVDHPALVLILSDDGLKRLGDLSALGPESLLIADAGLSLPATTARVMRLATGDIAKRVGAAAMALAVLTIGLVRGGWIDARLLATAAERSLGGRYRDANLKAIQTGIELAAAGAERAAHAVLTVKE